MYTADICTEVALGMCWVFGSSVINDEDISRSEVWETTVDRGLHYAKIRVMARKYHGCFEGSSQLGLRLVRCFFIGRQVQIGADLLNRNIRHLCHRERDQDYQWFGANRDDQHWQHVRPSNLKRSLQPAGKVVRHNNAGDNASNDQEYCTRSQQFFVDSWIDFFCRRDRVRFEDTVWGCLPRYFFQVKGQNHGRQSSSCRKPLQSNCR